MTPPLSIVATGTPKINTNLCLVQRITVKISKELVNWNKSYRAETLLSTDADVAADDKRDTIIRPQNFCGRIKSLLFRNSAGNILNINAECTLTRFTYFIF